MVAARVMTTPGEGGRTDLVRYSAEHRVEAGSGVGGPRRGCLATPVKQGVPVGVSALVRSSASRRDGRQEGRVWHVRAALRERRTHVVNSSESLLKEPIVGFSPYLMAR